MRSGRSDRAGRIGAYILLASVLVAGQPALPAPASAGERRVEEFKLVLRPAAEPRPALKYRLLPPLLDRQPGNAAVLYNRIAIGFGDVHPPSQREKIVEWQEMPLAELPLEEMQKTLDENRGVLDDLHLAARCEDCDWQLPLRGRDFTQLLLPTAQSMRHFARLLVLQARLQIARGDFDGAIRTLQTGFAMGRHAAEGPTLVHCLVGRAVCSMMAERVRELIQQPGSPNLYWTLTVLPRPLVDWRTAFENEMDVLYVSFPELRTVEDRSRTPEHWQALWEELAERVAGWQRGREESRRRPGPVRAAADALGRYPMAKQRLIEEGRPAEEVEKMPVPQVLLIHTMRTYDEARDQVGKWVFLPFYEDSPHRSARQWRDLVEALNREILPLGRSLLPAVESVRLSVARLEREIALLRTVEALRLHGAAHDGQLPASLEEVTEVPIPVDPVWWQPFQYQLRQGTATLEAQERVYPAVRFTIEFAR